MMKCDICREGVNDVTTLVCHLKSHKNISSFPYLSCPCCDKALHGLQKLISHLRRSHLDKRKICSICGKAFMTSHKLKTHSLRHSTFAEFLCAKCGKRFKRRDKLNEHLNRKHSNLKEEKSHVTKIKCQRIKRYRVAKLTSEELGKYAYTCTICITGFHRRGILVNHMTRIHPDIDISTVAALNIPVILSRKSFMCHYCDRTYMSNGKRKQHILNCHPGAFIANNSRHINTKDLGCVTVEPRICIFCPRQFLTNAKLLQHQRKLHPGLLCDQTSTS